MHHPRFLEFIGAPESACCSVLRPSEHGPGGLRHNSHLQHDAGMMSSNLQILGQFVTSLQRISSGVLSLAMGQVVFPSSAVDTLSPTPRAPPAASYMSAMGLWRPLGGPGGTVPLPTSSCDNCMNCRYYFPDSPGPSQH